MSHNDFTHLLDSIATLSPEQMQQLRRELESKMATTATVARPSADPLLGSMADHAELMDEIVEDTMRNRQQAAVTQPLAARPDTPKRKPLWERAAELRQSIPAEEWDKLPTDGARQLDHYIYGSPKRADK